MIEVSQEDLLRYLRGELRGEDQTPNAGFAILANLFLEGLTDEEKFNLADKISEKLGD